MAKIKCICKECGIEFLIDECYIKRDGKRLYCGIDCRNKNISGKDNPRYKPDEGWLNCIYCGDKFKVKPSSLILKKNRTYCTKECKEKNKIEYKTKSTCIECGKEFEHYKKRKPKYCSRICASVNSYRNNNQVNKGVQRGHGGKRIDLNNMYFRSSWESNYARYLNFLIKQKQIKKWEYEVDTFEFHKIKKGTRFYTPDFKVFDNNDNFVYHEVKGWMDDKSITRAKRMEKYYPEIKIILIDKKWFRSNGTMLSKIIPNWESANSDNIRLY